MNSPAKRRKTKHDASPATARSLDFFFAKQKAQATGPLDGEPSVSLEPEGGTIDPDEQLARQLQAEWDREDALSGSANPASTKLINGTMASTHVPHDGLGDKAIGSHSDAATETCPNLYDLDADELPTTVEASAEVFGIGKPHTLTLQSATADEDAITMNVPFDQSPLTFNPADHIPGLQKQWNVDGGSCTYALLTRAFVLVNSTQSRIKIVDCLVNLLRVIIEGDPESLQSAVWLATNSISPPYVDLELGLGGSAISKALKKVCGLDNQGLKTLYNKYGDAGDVAFEAKKRQSLTLRKPKPLSIKGVYEALVKIANCKGNGSVEVKQRIVERLVQDARGAEESRYIVRTLVQHLRIGAVKTTMLIALSRAFLLSRPPEAAYDTIPINDLVKLKKEGLTEVWSRHEEIVKACFARRPNYNDLVPALLEIGVCGELLLRCGLALHVPLRPMLGNITRDLGEMLTKLQGREFSCEYKYDGQRAQVHCDRRGKVTIFSRHLEVMTDKYPDLVALVPQIRGEDVQSFIMEGEVVAVDQETGDLKTFQTLANRARKDVVIGSVKIDVCLFAFDLMYLNGEELLDRPFRERRELLRSLFIEVPNRFTWVKSLDATSTESETVLEFYKSAIEIKCEGIMVKVLDNAADPALQQLLNVSNGDEVKGVNLLPADSPPATPKKPKGAKTNKKTAEEHAAEKASGARRKALLSTYEPDKRMDSWLKVKKDYDTTAADTLDLIPIAGWHGQGRKAAWWSPILLAVRNPSTGCLEAVTKCISGFTDKFYAANKEKYALGSENVISKPGYVEYAGRPDVWFEPQEVWEMAFADVTLSPTYTAAIGLVSEERGLSMRFPRFLRVREDKGLEEASTNEFLAGLWFKQEGKKNGEGGNSGGGDGGINLVGLDEDDSDGNDM